MKRLLAVLPVLISLGLAMPVALHAEEPANTMVTTSWSLDKAGKTQPRRQTVQGTGRRGQAVRRASDKPRVFGGAVVTNQVRRNQGKARAQVGVALPF